MYCTRFSTHYIVHTVYSAHNILDTKYILCTAHCIPYTEHSTLHNMRCTLHTAYYATMHRSHCILYSVHCVLHTAYRTVYIAEIEKSPYKKKSPGHLFQRGAILAVVHRTDWFKLFNFFTFSKLQPHLLAQPLAKFCLSLNNNNKELLENAIPYMKI